MPSLAARRAAVLAAGLLAGCDHEPPPVPFGPPLTLSPASLSLVVGEASSVGVGLQGGATARTRVRWVSSAPSVALVDSTPRVGRTAGDPVPVRGVAPGGALLTVTVLHEGQTITATVPVAVRPGS